MRWAGMVAVVAWVTAATGCGKNSHKEAMKAFEPLISDYMAVEDYEAGEGPPYVRGKVFPVNVNASKGDSLVYGHLKPELRANKPDEVGTVALIDCKHVLVGHYLPQGCGSPADCEKQPGYQGICEVTLIDRKELINTGLGRVRGQRPPKRLKNKKEWRGRIPRNAVASFIEQRPRKP